MPSRPPAASPNRPPATADPVVAAREGGWRARSRLERARASAAAAPLPGDVKVRLLARRDSRLTDAFVVASKAQTAHTQVANRAEAMARLQAPVDQAVVVPRVRRATRPTRASQQHRRQAAVLHRRLKATRGKVGAEG